MASADEPVVLVDYDARWPALFAAERARIALVVAPFALAIEHVGSSAVPELCAKPIIDMHIAVDPFEPAERYVATMAALGYVWRDDPADLGRHAFGLRDARGRRPVPGYNAHIVPRDGAEARRHLAFRDYLRAHPEAADEYCALKRRLAAAFGADRDGYTAAKSAFVEGILARALAARRPDADGAR